MTGYNDLRDGQEFYGNGYNQAIEDITEYIQKMKSYYTNGNMCSISESIIGENVCDDILKYLKEVVQKNEIMR